MTSDGTVRAGTRARAPRVLVGYDASSSAVHAVEAAARLVPEADATVVHLWHPPFASEGLRHRLAGQARTVEELMDLVVQEGRAEAERVAGYGVTLVRAAGWDAEQLVQRCYGGDGYELSRLAEERTADLVVIGSRGLSGVAAVLGSTSDLVVHVSPVPVLVVPSPMTSSERDALDAGPVLVATDGSPGAERAAATAADLFPDRELVRVVVDWSDGSAAPDVDESGVVRLPLRRRPAGARAVAATLSEFATERDAAVVVVGSRGRSASRELLLGSVAKAVLHAAHRPVLVVPAARAPGLTAERMS